MTVAFVVALSRQLSNSSSQGLQVKSRCWVELGGQYCQEQQRWRCSWRCQLLLQRLERRQKEGNGGGHTH